MVRFIDANVFLYAFPKPKRKLKEHEIKLKELAKRIINRINEGETVITSIVHFSEIANILEDLAPLNVAIEIEESILLKENIEIITIDKRKYLNSLDVSKTYGIGLNDALAYVIMKTYEISEIYSFDKDFDKLPDIRRVLK